MRISKARRSKRRGEEPVSVPRVFFRLTRGLGWVLPVMGSRKVWLDKDVLDANSWCFSTRAKNSSLVYPKYKLVPKPLMRREKYLHL